MLDERSEKIEKGLEDAEKASRRAAEMEQEFEQQMTKARKEGQEIVAQATQMGEKARQDILAEARESARAEIEKAKEEISRERDLAMGELRDQVADLSLSIAEKVIGQTLDEGKQRQLIDDFLAQTEELQ
jgi:F-type H+-transporting ATPase subunit b